MSRHPDAETVALYHEGLLPHRKAARLSAHLSRCPQCAMLRTGLASVTAILSAAGPSSLPPSLATRLDAVLASEAARATAARASTAAAAPDGGPHPGTATPDAGGGSAADSGGQRRQPAARRRPTGRGAGRGRLVLRIVSATATVAALSGAGYALSQLASGGASGSSASSASAGKAAAGPASSGRAPVRPAQPAGQGPAASGSPFSAGLPVIASGTDYRPGRLRAQVVSVLGEYPSVPAAGSHAAPVPAAVARTFPHLSGCVRRVSGGHPVRLVDAARYAGKPAAVIVVQSGATHRAWVVGAECSATSSNVITWVSLPRGR